MFPQLNIKAWKDSKYYITMLAIVKALPNEKFLVRIIYTEAETNQATITRAKLIQILERLTKLPDKR